MFFSAQVPCVQRSWQHRLCSLDSDPRWTFHRLNVASAFPSRFGTFHSSVLQRTQEDLEQWNRNWPNLNTQMCLQLDSQMLRGTPRLHAWVWWTCNLHEESCKSRSEWNLSSLRNVFALRTLISSASCKRTTSERMPRCFCLKAQNWENKAHISCWFS